MRTPRLTLRIEVDVQISDGERGIRVADFARALGISHATAVRLTRKAGLFASHGSVRALTRESARELIAAWSATTSGRARFATLVAASLTDQREADSVRVPHVPSVDGRAAANRLRAFRAASDADE